jgi:DNA-binding MarR family transcriptional regulator
MTTGAPRTPARPHGELTTVPAKRRRRYNYFVWPFGSQAAYAACDTLSAALHEAAYAQSQGITDVCIVRSDGYEVQVGCTYCGSEGEALRVASHPALRDYWCTSCWEMHGIRIRNRRLSPLQQHILRWLREDAAHASSGTASSHKALVKALAKDKGNISKSLQNLAEKNLIHIHYSPGGQAVSVELTPIGWYKAHSL